MSTIGRSMSRHAAIILMIALVALTGCATTGSHDVPQARALDERPASPVSRSAPGLTHRIVWYLPNRTMDLLDLFRARVRIGPGFAFNVRVTEHADAFNGTYYTGFIGLPGPRMEPLLPAPLGLECEKGIKLLGVDATDDMNHEPGYAPTEVDVGLHLLVAGAEVGFDPVEMGDFLVGWLLIDPRGDDH